MSTFEARSSAVATGQENRKGKKPVTFWIDSADHTALRMYAFSMGETLQDLMAEAVRKLIDKPSKPAKKGGKP